MKTIGEFPESGKTPQLLSLSPNRFIQVGTLIGTDRKRPFTGGTGFFLLFQNRRPLRILSPWILFSSLIIGKFSF